jgi:hypothetical protein
MTRERNLNFSGRIEITEVLFLVCVVFFDYMRQCRSFHLFELQYVTIMDHALSSPGTDPCQVGRVPGYTHGDGATNSDTVF